MHAGWIETNVRLIPIAVRPAWMARKPVEMRDGEGVDPSIRLDGVAGEHGVEPAAPNVALPLVERVVLRRRSDVRALRRKRPRSVTNRIRSQDADRANLGISREVRQKLHRGRRGACRPCRVRMKAVPFVEENALSALENDRAGFIRTRHPRLLIGNEWSDNTSVAGPLLDRFRPIEYRRVGVSVAIKFAHFLRRIFANAP